MMFWDSSAVVVVLVEQKKTEVMLELYRRDPHLIAWWGTRVECASAVARLEREGSLSAKGTARALGRLDRLAQSWQEVQPRDPLREVARRLLRSHSLAAADAFQLAAAIAGAESRPATLPLVCLDGRLALAAQREGFPVLPG